jgi:hypothetical protein
MAVFKSRQNLSQINTRMDSNKEKAYLFAGVFSIFLLMALKEPITGDYSRYATHFMTIMFKSLKGQSTLLSEPGFFTLNRIIRSITNETFYFFAITSGIICFSVGRFIYKFADNKRYAIFFYYTIGLFAFSMAGLRQTLAMSICLFSYTAIKKRKIFRFVLLIFIAFLFHRSAVFFFPAFFIANIKWKFHTLFGVLSIYSVVCIFFNRIYEYIVGWLDYDYGIESTGNGGIFLIILLIISVLALIYRKRLLELDSNNIIFINLHFTVLALWIFRMFTRTVERPSYYYLFASIILLDKILSLQSDREDDVITRKILVLLSLLFFGLFFIYRLLRNGNLLPYIFI